MSFKAIIFIAALAASSSAMAATDITFQQDGGDYIGIFKGSASQNAFKFDLPAGPALLSDISASAILTGKFGYTITGAKLDGSAIDCSGSGSGGATSTSCNWSGNLTAGTHYLDISGTPSKNGSFTGQISFSSAAPEPAAWSMMILGVGGMGAALRTRRRRITA